MKPHIKNEGYGGRHITVWVHVCWRTLVVEREELVSNSVMC